MARRISGVRKTVYCLGMGLMILGGVLFASTFVSFAMHIGDFSNFDARARSLFLRAFGGMGLVFVGGILRGIGGRGLAGSGVVLDPARARDDLEPYSRMAGSMVKDALEEARVNSAGRADKIIMLKCTACGKLNEEDAKFCQECGKEM